MTSDLEPLDRRLVPFSQTLLGVETVWGAETKRVRLVSGGYLDDVLEAYDDLESWDERRVRDSDATLLRSMLLDDLVLVAVWREGVEPPCDAHALIATGLTEVEFEEQLESIE